MTPILEDAVLWSDLDCNGFSIFNVGSIVPVPDNLIGTDDDSLTEGRVPLDGSVTNDSVDTMAAIDQSKLNFNGLIPSAWTRNSTPPLTDEPRAAQGDKVERLAKKGVVNGYVALDANGKIPSSHLTPGTATALTSIGMTVKPPLHMVGPHVITTAGTFTVAWDNNAPPNSYFGASGALDHGFHFRDPEYLTYIDQNFLATLSADKFTSGVFALARLPVAKPMGTGHASGILADPGPSAPNMYLGRDLNWHHFVVNNPATAYQPDVPDVTIVLDWWEPHKPVAGDPSLVKAHITIRSLLKDSHLFYRVTSQPDAPLAYKEVNHDATPDDVHISIETNDFDFIEAYASKPGYNDSKIEQWTVITPITDLNLSP